jgi:2-polyprenyl-3-methyl-5-hydroxy-6-metoxy-1,4-benzoquinol methylase
MTNTNKYYQDNAGSFYSATVDIDMSTIYQRFLPLIPTGGAILDAGCGSGRDSLNFKAQGYHATAIDASSALCELAANLLDQEVHCVGFEEITWHKQFDGVWACASLLHVAKDQLPSVLKRLARSLKAGGVLYASFKYGTTARVKGGRAFTDMTEDTLAQLLQSVPMLSLKDSWMTADRRVDAEQNWLNVILTVSH